MMVRVMSRSAVSVDNNSGGEDEGEGNIRGGRSVKMCRYDDAAL